MFCKYCGNEIDDGALFCPKCGKRVNEQVAEESNASQSGGSSTATSGAGNSQAAQENLAQSERVLKEAEATVKKIQEEREKEKSDTIRGLVIGSIIAVLIAIIWGLVGL